jgi:hypothetical protein
MSTFLLPLIDPSYIQQIELIMIIIILVLSPITYMEEINKFIWV